ncbi:uncharacterized protein LOC128273301 [Anopheles cruzii]|uniref:uncharacterized protein LOC128273301 n=1 Tax=Anopheles cruzii TaxID=68878 RepID=UPI0022EC7B33|nr:uncharacterized protein LOC128273301 [Anopheles cruzii]
MNSETYRCKYTWPVAEGSPEKQIQVQVSESLPPSFVPLDELLDLEMCLVLSGTDRPEACEMQLSFIPLYLPRAVSLVVECPVIECYYGRLNEYYRTFHGELVYTLDEVKVFRFDIRFTSDIDELQLKFISPNTHPLCLYGTRLYMERNPNPLRTMMAASAGSRINVASVQQRLQNTELSEKAESCKRLVLGSLGPSTQNAANNNPSPAAGDEQQSLDSNLAHLLGKVLQTDTVPNANGGSVPSLVETSIKHYIDKKFVELEHLIESKLCALERRQNEKLDQILGLLQPRPDLFPESIDSLAVELE